jgi:fructooligosaccharide transport system substrate-binding protein
MVGKHVSQTTSVLVAVAILLLAIACSPAPGAAPEATPAPAPETAPETAPEPAPETAPEPAPETAESHELTFWMASDPALEEAMDEILAGYMEAHPNVTVRREAFPFAEYFQRLLTAFAGGAAPDVFWIDIRTASFAEQGSLIPVEQFADQENLDEITPSALIEGTWNGTLYTMPLHQISEALYVNRQMAEEAGIRIPTSVEDAWTWEEFAEIAEQLTVREGNQVRVWGYGQQRHLQDWSSLPFIHQSGGQPVSDDLTQATGYLNSPESVEAMTFMQSLFTDPGVIAVDVVPEGFNTGQIAIFQAPSTYHTVLRTRFPDVEYIVVPLFRGAECGATVGGWNVGIANTTPDPAVAWSLVDWMTRERHQEWVETSGYLPIREPVMAQPQFQEQPWSIFMDTLTECPVGRPATPHYQFFADTFQAAVRDIALGGEPQATLDEAAATMDEQLSR